MMSLGKLIETLALLAFLEIQNRTFRSYLSCTTYSMMISNYIDAMIPRAERYTGAAIESASQATHFRVNLKAGEVLN